MVTIVIIVKLTLDNDSLDDTLKLWLGIPLILFVVFGMFFTFLDFVTLGWVKRKRWLSRIYFPFYWVFSKITFSFLYRPLVYNFLDNKFGRQVSIALVPIYILIVVSSSLNYKTSNYFNGDLNSNSIIANSKNYEDALTEDMFVERASISSKIITTNYLKVFMANSDNFDDYIFSFNPGLKPKKDIRGLDSDMIVTNDLSWVKKDSLRKSYIKTLNKIFKVEIDSINYKSEFIFSKNSKQQRGFETYIGIKNLNPGKHLLKITRQRIRKKDTQTVILERIPFWYYPN